MLSVNPVNFAGELEAAIDARGGLVDIGTVADTNLATAQAVATDQIQHDAGSTRQCIALSIPLRIV